VVFLLLRLRYFAGFGSQTLSALHVMLGVYCWIHQRPVSIAPRTSSTPTVSKHLSRPSYTLLTLCRRQQQCPCSLTFVDITYKVTLKGKAQQEKVILNNMNGYIKPGTFVAIMGPSGQYQHSTEQSE